MRRFLVLAVVPVFVAALPAAYPDNKKQGQSKTVPTAEQDYQALSNAQIIGKIVSVQASDKTLRLEIEYSLLQPKHKNSVSKASPAVAQLYRNQQQMLQNQQKAVAARNTALSAKHLQQLQQHTGHVGKIGGPGGGAPAHFTIKTEKKQFDLEAVDDVRVRIAKLAVEVDDKGKPKRYSDQELRERKGPDPSLPGYTSNFEQLKAGQVVKIKLGRSKPAKAKDEPNNDDHPKITMIVITESADTPPADGAKKGK
jgi:hypothetical protein